MIDMPQAMHQNDKIQTTPITNENNQMSKTHDHSIASGGMTGNIRKVIFGRSDNLDFSFDSLDNVHSSLINHNVFS